MNATRISDLADRELSVRSRVGHVALLLGGLSMSAITGSLWLTEPHLPARTAYAFAILCLMGLGWAGFAAWVLQSRRVLLAFQKVVAARFAFSYCSAALAGSLYVAIDQGHAAGWWAAGLFGVMLLIAGLLLAQARSRYRQLRARQAELERQLKQQG